MNLSASKTNKIEPPIIEETEFKVNEKPSLKSKGFITDNDIKNLLINKLFGPRGFELQYVPTHDVFTLGSVIFATELLMLSKAIPMYKQNYMDVMYTGLINDSHDAKPDDYLNIYDYLDYLLTRFKSYLPDSWTDFYYNEIHNYPDMNQWSDDMNGMIEVVYNVDEKSGKLLRFVFDNTMSLDPTQRIAMNALNNELIYMTL